MKKALKIYLFLALNSSMFFSFNNALSSDSHCGKLLNSVVKLNPEKKSASLDKFFSSEEKFCDGGTEEINGNYEISLYDKHKSLLNQKTIFINDFTIYENLKSKAAVSFNKTVITKEPQFRLIKFAIRNSFQDIATYKVISKTDKKVYGEGKVVIETVKGVKQ